MIRRFIDKLQESNSVCIAFLGDSVTHGYFDSNTGLHSTTDYEAVYHHRLQQKINMYFPTKSINIINAGVGGNSSQDGLNRIEQDVLRYSPDLTVVCFGLNDINNKLETYTHALRDIFTRLKDQNSDVIFMTPNMLNTKISSSFLVDYATRTAEYQNSGKMDQYINAAIQTSIECSVTICDCYGTWKQLHNIGVDTDALLANHINHPTREMHELFASSLFNTIFLM